MPFVNVHHAIPPIHFHHRRDQRDHSFAHFANVRAFIHRQPVRQFHQRRRRARLRRVNRSGDVVNRYRLGHDAVRLRIIHLDRPRIGQLRQQRPIRIQIFQILRRRNRHRDHLPALFRLPDGENFHPRTGLLQQPHVFVDFLGVRQNSRRARHISQHHLRRRNHSSKPANIPPAANVNAGSDVYFLIFAEYASSTACLGSRAGAVSSFARTPIAPAASKIPKAQTARLRINDLSQNVRNMKDGLYPTRRLCRGAACCAPSRHDFNHTSPL